MSRSDLSHMKQVSEVVSCLWGLGWPSWLCAKHGYMKMPHKSRAIIGERFSMVISTPF